MIADTEVEAALKYMAKTDEPCAKAKARVKALEYRLKTEKAVQFLNATGTMAEKESSALASSEYNAMVDEYETAVYEFETMAAKRERAILTIDVWRSEQANRRAG